VTSSHATPPRPARSTGTERRCVLVNYHGRRKYLGFCDGATARSSRARPLRRLWENLAPRLAAEFGVNGETFRQTVLVHGSGWLRWLDRALRSGNENEAAYWERKLRGLVNGETFHVLPAPPEV